MHALFVDNFRGFSNCTIPLDDVNFFLGENSTGKSSILALMKVFASQSFWMTSEFNIGDVRLGNFEDLVSAESTNRTNFTVGYITSEKSTKKNTAKIKERGAISHEIAALIVTFSNKNGTPCLQNFTYIENKKIVSATISSGGLTYATKPFKSKVPFNSIAGAFTELISYHKSTKSKPHTAQFPAPIKKVEDDHGLLFLRLILEKNIDNDIDFKGKLKGSFTAPDPIVWVAPIRDKPSRFYDNIKPGYSAEGSHIPHVINDILNGTKNSGKSLLLTNAFKKFGKESGLFKNITAPRYGKGNSSPFRINIILKNKPLRISDVGYGVSQILPVIVEAFIRRKETQFAIQQPEVHLHPKAQAALGGFLHTLASTEYKRFFVETHSDFLINRFRINLKKSKEKNLSSQVLFFERSANGNSCHPIKIQDNGQFQNKKPKSFQDFFIREQLEMLEI